MLKQIVAKKELESLALRISEEQVTRSQLPASVHITKLPAQLLSATCVMMGKCLMLLKAYRNHYTEPFLCG